MLKPKQIKCLELMIKGELSDKEIAEAINITQKTICEWKKNCKEFQDEYNNLMRKSLQYAAPKAFRKQIALLGSKNEMVAHLAAKDILDRAGFKPNEKSEKDVEEQIARIQKLNAETARIKGETTDDDKENDGFMEALRSEAQEIWDEQ